MFIYCRIPHFWRKYAATLQTPDESPHYRSRELFR